MPPGYRLPRAALAALIALAAAPLISFLPMEYLGPLPEWRTMLVENWGIALPTSGTSQPWVTFEAWLLMVSGLVWFTWCVSRGSTVDDRRTVGRLLVAGCSGIAVLTLLHKAGMIEILWWKFPPELGQTFGPFANRNHTSSLMAIASVLCAAVSYDCYRNKQRHWFLFLPMLIPLFIVIISNTSRAGVLLFFLGMTAWVWTAAMRKSFFKKVAVASAFFLSGISLVVILGGSLSERFGSGLPKPGRDSPFDARSAIYSDVVKLTSTTPWAGLGLGCFSEAYPHLASFHEPRVRFIHPESDWLWITAEGGMLSVMALATAFVLFALMTGPWAGSRNDESNSRQDRRLRQAAGIGALIAAAHGVVDVPNHSLGYGLVSSLMLALAIRPSRVSTPATWIDRAVFRALGLAVLACGVSWLAIAMGVPAVPGASTSRLLSQQARKLSGQSHDGEAMKVVERAISMNPLNWTLYFLRAQLHLRLKHPEQTAMLDFGRARAIEPHYAQMCIEEGHVWLDYQSRFAIQAWSEFLRRHPERTDYYSMLLGLVHSTPDLKMEARKIATTPILKLVYLRYCDRGPEFEAVVSDLILQQPSLDGLEPEEKVELFRLWQQRGDRSKLKAMLQKFPAWLQDGWMVMCEELAKDGDYEGAYRLATHYQLPPISPSVSTLADIGQLEQAFLFNPTDPRRGIDLYFAQKSKLQWNGALATLDKVASLPNSPPYVFYEMASVYAQKEDYRKAWELVARFLAAPK